jgi:hypothetical protein
MSKYFIIAAFFLFATVIYADTTQVHVDEPTEHTESKRFSMINAIESLAIIGESLSSFKKVVETATAEEPIILKDYKHTDWEMLNLGHPNMLATIEGTLRKQSYINAKLRYELSLSKSKENSSISGNVSNLKKAYLDRKKEYTIFVKNMRVAD